jgi:hypothetical protein
MMAMPTAFCHNQESHEEHTYRVWGHREGDSPDIFTRRLTYRCPGRTGQTASTPYNTAATEDADPETLPAVDIGNSPATIKATELKAWWVAQAEAEIEKVADKAAAYGSNSLAEVGRLAARLGDREVDTKQALVLGCLVYAHGKLERCIDAARRGELPALDSVHDTKVYMGMIERILETGDWP